MLGLLFAAVVSLGIMLGLYRVGSIRSDVARNSSLLRYWLSVLFAVVALFVPLAFKRVVWDYLTIRGTPLYMASFAADLVFLLAVIVAILALSSRLADSVLALPRVRSREMDATLIRILFRVMGIVAAVIVFLEGGRYLGFPLTTLLASAGIGGLAIALSAQGTVKGLFGTVTVLLDRPYRVGERIVARGHDGVVEEIGLRSTKIREFLTNHLISVPNDQMADADIVNIGKRQHICRQCDLHIPIDTTRDKVEKAVAAIRTVLESQAGMDPEFPPQVFFNDFNPDSFNIRVIYWHVPPDLWSYYRSCEQVNLKIFKAFEEQGIQFSLPVRHSYWKTDDTQGPLEVRLAEPIRPFTRSESGYLLHVSKDLPANSGSDERPNLEAGWRNPGSRTAQQITSPRNRIGTHGRRMAPTVAATSLPLHDKPVERRKSYRRATVPASNRDAGHDLDRARQCLERYGTMPFPKTISPRIGNRGPNQRKGQ